MRVNYFCARIAASLFAIAAAGFGAVRADTLFSDDFQDGKTTSWQAVGAGDVHLSSYAENVSLLIGAGGAAVTAVSTTGYEHVRLDLSFAASHLGADDACVADVSIDAGHHWIEIFRIVRGQDDGVTLHSGGAANRVMDGTPRLVIRVRTAAAPNSAATCWADNILLSGEKPDATAFRPAFSANGARIALTYSELTGGGVPAPVDMAAFMPATDAKPATNIFRGRLMFGTERAGGSLHILKDAFGDADANNGAARHLPTFDFAFVQSGDALIPKRRGASRGSNAEWEFILEPGHVWDEPADHGLTRAAFPFALEERNANCMHNGMAIFLFGKNSAVSDVAYEIAGETCFYFKFDMWGRAAAAYYPGTVADEAGITGSYAREVAARMPVRAIDAMVHDFPGADTSQFGSSAEVPARDMTLYGVVANGVNYVSGCASRFGAYPDCAVLDLPSYSLAKSIVAGLGTMRLNLLYPGVTNEIVARYVPECAPTKSWDDVTFANLLDMGSGHFNALADQADENAPDLTPFFLAEDHSSRIAFACNHYPRKALPETIWVYHTADSYLLGTALSAYYRQKAGGDFYDDILAAGIWRKLALSPPVYVSRRTYDSAAQPFTGYGLTLHRDDIAKIADFINVEHGAVGAQQLIDPTMLRAALQQNPNDRGLKASGDDYRYHYGFWAWNAQHVLGCRKETWIPFMSGYGGIAVALMPNGMAYYYFSDSGIWAWSHAAREADKIKPFCER